jgi:two-component system phosphate regulon sensor histidine kinase PhoR
MRRSVFLRVFGGHLLVVALLASALLFFLLNTVRTGHIDSLTFELEHHARTLADRFEHDPWPSPDSLDAVLKRLGNRVAVRFTVVAPDGRVLGDSREQPGLMEDHSARPELIAAFRGGVGASTRFSRTLNSDMLYVAVPLERDGQVVAAVRAAVMMGAVNALLRRLGTEVVAVTGLLVLLALVLSLFVARDIARPVGRLVRAARRVGSGDLDVRVPAGRDDELGELSAGFNDMVTRLRALVAGEKDRKEKLDKIIGAMREGLVVLDRDGRVTLANSSFVGIAGGERPEGSFLWEVVRESTLAELVLASDDETASATVRFGGRTFLCSATRLASSRETVITFHDVTEIERMAAVKRDLVVNASHELRTPLTAIKGFLETLAETLTGDERRYVEVISRHTERLISIVRDLLVLSQVEEGPKLDIVPVDLGRVATDVLRIFERRAQEKGLELGLEVEPGLPPAAGDEFHLEQVLVNLVDNAVKYTDAGHVRVRLGREGDRVRLVVEDTGIGIAADQVPRLFERFFVTDKARSRKLGGTGLGLAIVKHIVAQHNGAVEVESEPGRGSRFSVTLPTA